ncbi:hypothetical protein ACFE04_025859 [Oxalis oulophora]
MVNESKKAKNKSAIMNNNNNNNNKAKEDRRPDALGNLHRLPDELISVMLENLTPRDFARLSCVSSVMYILCNDEPQWMTLCLKRASGLLQYKGSWKKTTLHLENLPDEIVDNCRGSSLHFDGFSSMFLYKRFYRCHTSLNAFSFDDGNIERKIDLSVKEFSDNYDVKKPVLLTGLTDAWPARKTWTIDQLMQRHGDTLFRISQRSPKKVLMKFKDYVSYMNMQHDEDPLYIFDDKFGEAAPDLLTDYSVPHLFQEDLFDVLDKENRPPYRWLIIGPERSGASWHVDPGLTSAWNTLLCGRKRWALYPPGRVPIGVTVNVNDEDGDVHIDTPSSLQWWLDFYPLLADEDKPIECTQQPGETIFVPSGWWHCVLNLENTVAVTQNFVNSKNFEFVCLDMAPGYHHKGVSRAGFLAFDQDADADKTLNDGNELSYANLTRKEKRARIDNPGKENSDEEVINGVSESFTLRKNSFSYDVEFLAKLLDDDRDHYNSPWSPGNSIGQREMREWLYKLWNEKPAMRDLIWKGACLAVNAGKWSDCLAEILAFHNLPTPADHERLPVGTGSNPVYLLSDFVVKIYVEAGLETSIYGLGTELEFYSELNKSKSALKNHVPEVLASGIIYLENDFYKIVPWDGTVVPDVLHECNLIPEICSESGFPFGVWSKMQFEYKKSMLTDESTSAIKSKMWPYIIIKRCKGKIFGQLRDILPSEDLIKMASSLGEQLCDLHLLPYLPFTNSNSDTDRKHDLISANGHMEDGPINADFSADWNIFIRTLNRKKIDVSSRLTKWGEPIPKTLIDKVHEYLPDDFAKFIYLYKDENKGYKPCWIHSDIMDDNIQMDSCCIGSSLSTSVADTELMDVGPPNGDPNDGEKISWHLSYILDFSDLSIGDPIYDVIPIYLDVFKGDPKLFKQFLESYKLRLERRSHPESINGGDKLGRLSYHAMCYCIVHDENILGAIFSMWKELRTASSWEEVEFKVWSELNNYNGYL